MGKIICTIDCARIFICTVISGMAFCCLFKDSARRRRYADLTILRKRTLFAAVSFFLSHRNYTCYISHVDLLVIADTVTMRFPGNFSVRTFLRAHYNLLNSHVDILFIKCT